MSCACKLLDRYCCPAAWPVEARPKVWRGDARRGYTASVAGRIVRVARRGDAWAITVQMRGWLCAARSRGTLRQAQRRAAAFAHALPDRIGAP